MKDQNEKPSVGAVLEKILFRNWPLRLLALLLGAMLVVMFYYIGA